MKKVLSIIICLLINLNAQSKLGSVEEPLRYFGDLPDQKYTDGRLPQLVGVENIQVMRANRSNPELSDGFGWTYNHAPMLAYWNGKFYLEYLSNPIGEHIPPGHTMLTSSVDGQIWQMPIEVFPPYNNKNAIMHQRMGFYVSPSNRLLIIGCYAVNPNPNEGNGIGRVVREIYKDGSMGPIYFVRIHNKNNWDETNVDFPFFTKSADAGFVEACNALLSDKLITLQWWEEDQGEDGFFKIAPRFKKDPLKALSYFHRKDGKVVGLWKLAFAMLSEDNGQSWSTPVQIETVPATMAKIWGQKTDDDKFILALCPTVKYRYPLCLSLSNDGISFEQFHIIHDEMPLKRFSGAFKNNGPQYVRGIVEGNGNPPGDELWLTYSMTKEDIWISRIQLPINYQVSEEVNDNFENLSADKPLPGWNLYKPKWAPISITKNPKGQGNSLMMQDKDPYDYARITRTFPKAKIVELEFKLLASQNNFGKLEIDVVANRGQRSSSFSLTSGGLIEAVDKDKIQKIAKYFSGDWIDVKLKIDCENQIYSLHMNGALILENAQFIDDVDAVERLVIRTGNYRGGKPEIDRMSKGDLENADTPEKLAVYYLDDIVSKKIK